MTNSDMKSLCSLLPLVPHSTFRIETTTSITAFTNGFVLKRKRFLTGENKNNKKKS